MYCNMAVSTMVVKLQLKENIKCNKIHNNTLQMCCQNQKLNMRKLVQVQILDKRHLVQQTVGHCCPGQTSGGGLVWDIGQEDVQVVLE